MSGDRPSFYALPPGGWRDYWTLLHPPYTLWHLSYAAIGASLASELDPGRLGLALLAFFLAVGLAAHALDELNGRPLRTTIPRWALLALAGTGLLGALVVGVYGCSTVSWWGVPFMVVGGFVVPAYGLEWWGGRFHTEAWFAGMWGGFPALAGYFAQTGRVDVRIVVACLGCAWIAAAQRRLSTPVRMLRRQVSAVQGEIVFADGSRQTLDGAAMRTAPEGALRVMWLGMVALAAAMVAARWP